MRTYIEDQLNKNGLGSLVYVKGPEGGTRDQPWYSIVIKYRIDANQNHLDDGRIDVVLGYKKKGSYWNQRQIRVAVAKEGERVKMEKVVHVVWNSAQKALTSGQTKSGAFEL